jgi:heat-inducible transcriptional repressor
VAIGRENMVEELFACSVLKSRFTFSDHTVGTVGIVGPKRMDYPRLMGLVRYLAESLSRSLRQFPIS